MRRKTRRNAEIKQTFGIFLTSSISIFRNFLNNFRNGFTLFAENETYRELKSEISLIKEHLSEETQLQQIMEDISVSLQHLDALLTGYEIDSTTSDLNVLSDHLRNDYDRLERLNEKSLSKREKYSQNLLVKLNYLNALYADLLVRLQKLQKDQAVQVLHHTV